MNTKGSVKKCLHCVVSGRVQGVFYRASTQAKAEQLGIAGWVRNLPDGKVELEACGTSAQLGKLHEWLWQGPGGAQVSDVVCTPTSREVPDDKFSIRY